MDAQVCRQLTPHSTAQANDSTAALPISDLDQAHNTARKVSPGEQDPLYHLHFPVGQPHNMSPKSVYLTLPSWSLFMVPQVSDILTGQISGMRGGSSL